MNLLEVEGLHVSYGGIAALRGVALTVGEGEIVAVIGPNGAGKSTLLRTLVGLQVSGHGRILMRGASIAGRAPEQLVAEGICLVPEGRHVFGSLSVAENIRLGATTRRDARRRIEADFEYVLELFPVLRERQRQRAGQLSGGEQQMLAIARALMAAPRLLLLDEPSLGLAPLVVRAVYAALAQLRVGGLTILVVEQNVRLALEQADRAYVLNSGRVTAFGACQSLLAMPDLEQAYFGVVA